MPAMPDVDGPPAGQRTPGGGRPVLRLSPFRAVGYAAGQVGDLAAVTCPPYDVIGDDGIGVWQRSHPANVVRLVLPRDGATTAERYAGAARLLKSWLDSGVLVRDRLPALYVYEQRIDTQSFVGLVGAVGLSDPADGVVLPHEDVFPGPVADRLALMESTGANLEPILLVYDGDGAASDVVDRAAATSPWLDVCTQDGIRHRLWRITDPDVQRTVADDLAGRQALIADGHHRYASYRALQGERRAAGAGDGPWDAGLAMLVDSIRHPPRLAGIHRVVEQVELGTVLDAARRGFRVHPLAPSAAEPRDPGPGDPPRMPQPASTSGPGSEGPAEPFAVTVTDGTARYLVESPNAALANAAVEDLPPPLHRLDATLVHELLLRRLLGIAPEDQRVRYVHDTAEAVAHARRHRGVAILMRPPAVADVVAVAAAGERMPRKSTSFGPKPRNGFLLRLLDR